MALRSISVLLLLSIVSHMSDGLFFCWIRRRLRRFRTRNLVFNIEVQYENFRRRDVRCVYPEYFDRWRRIITSKLSTARVNSQGRPPTSCGALPDTVDDLYICLIARAIDGPGGVLGFGQPVLFRDAGDGFPGIAEIQLDSADLGSSSLEAVIQREVGHSLGIGTMWEDRDLSQQPNPSCFYDGTAANQEWQDMSGCGTTVPLETGNVTQFRCMSWDGDCFQNELMSSAPITSGAPISRVSVAALEDLGYSVDYGAANGVSLNPSCTCSRRRQLSFDPDRNRKPTLSEEGRRRAQKAGRELLKEHPSTRFAVNDEEMNDGWGSVKNYVRVMYEEEGVGYSVEILLD